MIERNKILRQITPDGQKLIDVEGNYLVREFQLPFTNYYLYFPNYGMPLKDRKKLCESELARMVIKLTEAQEKMKKEEIQSVTKSDKQEDKEWAVFKKIRLFLEANKKKET